jgi:hypothetical protein
VVFGKAIMAIFSILVSIRNIFSTLYTHPHTTNIIQYMKYIKWTEIPTCKGCSFA